MRREEGFTLVELMVVLVIAGMLLAGVYTMMIRQQKSYQTQDQVIEVQQNLRSAFILLRHDLRMIGYGLTAGTAPITSHLNNQAGLNGTDAITVMANTGGGTVVMPNGGNSSYPLVTAAPITVAVSSVGGFSASQVDLVDLSTGTLIANANVTAVTQAVPPALSTLTLAPCPVVACPAAMNLKLMAGSYIGQSPQTIAYSVDINGALSPDCQNPPCLERTVGGVVSVLAEGVEDFQVAYGFDGINGRPLDGVLTEIGAAGNDDEWVYNATGDTWPADTSGLREIRISLLLQTINRDPSYTGGTTGTLEDHNWNAPLDGYRRRVVQFIENVRNLSL
ncbi:MAG TPA: PilW family protein [Nitrospiria bacterium]|nr:PilW family protein [Nitrospiria bacterium]